VALHWGNNYNSPDELKNLADIDDDYIVYNFHFYNPFFFTHQKATGRKVPWRTTGL